MPEDPKHLFSSNDRLTQDYIFMYLYIYIVFIVVAKFL